jgi:hypothetical protein
MSGIVCLYVFVGLTFDFPFLDISQASFGDCAGLSPKMLAFFSNSVVIDMITHNER